jgi:hypothetical protein
LKNHYSRLFENKLTSIEKDTFKGLIEVENLFLNDNSITNIEDFIFSDMINLSTLFTLKFINKT